MRWIKKPFLRVLFCIGSVILSIAITIGSLYGLLLGWAMVEDTKNAYIAKTIIDPKAEAYIAAQYPGNDFIVEDAYSVFKDNCYRVKVHSQSSPDTYFALDYHYKTYELERDGFDTSVTSGSNTRSRIVKEYQELVEESLSSIPGLDALRTDFTVYSENGSPSDHFSPDGLDNSTLILDHNYDVAAMGADYGDLEITILEEAENVNIQRYLEILTEIDKKLTQDGIGYSLIKITLQDAWYPDTTQEFHIYGVTPEDLHCDDPLARLQQMWDEQEANRQAIKNGY